MAYRPLALNQTFGFLNKEFNRVTPDFFVAVLHKRLVGDGAPLPVVSSNEGVLLWAHCPPSDTHASSSGMEHDVSDVLVSSRRMASESSQIVRRDDSL